MTREERHIAVLNRMLESMDVYDSIQPTTERKKAIKAAIQALSQEPTEKPMCDRNICISNEYNGIGCDECVVNKPQQPCEDVISREDAIAEINDTIAGYIPFFDGRTAKIPLELSKAIMRVPSVTHKSGKWRPVYQGDEIINYRCSECEFGNTFGKSIYRMNFCPNCGAKMIEPQESEE